MKPVDPTPTGRIPETAEAPAEAMERAPSKPQDGSAPTQRARGTKPEWHPRKRRKPFVL